MGDYTGVTLDTSINIVLKDRMQTNNQKNKIIRYDGMTAGEKTALIQAVGFATKLSIARVIESETFVNTAYVPSTTGEKSDFVTLRFEDDAQYAGTDTFPDPGDTCFVTDNGTELKPLATLAAGAAGSNMKGLADYIQAILDGKVLVKSGMGAQVTTFIGGTRVN